MSMRRAALLLALTLLPLAGCCSACKHRQPCCPSPGPIVPAPAPVSVGAGFPPASGIPAAMPRQ